MPARVSPLTTLMSADAAIALSSLARVTSWHVYTVGELCEDLRFYLGWVIGLLIAPNPVPDISGRQAPEAPSDGSQLRNAVATLWRHAAGPEIERARMPSVPRRL